MFLPECSIPGLKERVREYNHILTVFEKNQAKARPEILQRVLENSKHHLINIIDACKSSRWDEDNAIHFIMSMQYLAVLAENVNYTLDKEFFFLLKNYQEVLKNKNLEQENKPDSSDNSEPEYTTTAPQNSSSEETRPVKKSCC
jgi:hypothetical protein